LISDGSRGKINEDSGNETNIVTDVTKKLDAIHISAHFTSILGEDYNKSPFQVGKICTEVYYGQLNSQQYSIYYPYYYLEF